MERAAVAIDARSRLEPAEYNTVCDLSTLVRITVNITSRKRFVLISMLTLAFLCSFARPSSAFLDKTRFAAHLGVAYFCFHHWVLVPVRHGDFSNGAPHRIATMVKGGAALLFAVHEVKVSEKIARKSNSPLLHKLDGKLVALAATFAAVGTNLKAGNFSPNDITGLSSSTESVSSDTAAATGQPIKDVPIPTIGSSNSSTDDTDTQ